MLVIDVTNPGDHVLPLVLRILDEHHTWQSNDRLNLPLEVPPNSRATVNVALAAVQSVPATRPMDMARIANLALFARQAIPGHEFYVSRIWLE
jgi:hypothetical protein